MTYTCRCFPSQTETNVFQAQQLLEASLFGEGVLRVGKRKLLNPRPLVSSIELERYFGKTFLLSTTDTFTAFTHRTGTALAPLKHTCGSIPTLTGG